MSVRAIRGLPSNIYWGLSRYRLSREAGLWALPGWPPDGGAGIRASEKAGAVRRRLGLADDLVGEEGEAVADGPGVEEAHARLGLDMSGSMFAQPMDF